MVNLYKQESVEINSVVKLIDNTDIIEDDKINIEQQIRNLISNTEIDGHGSPIPGSTKQKYEKINAEA